MRNIYQKIILTVKAILGLYFTQTKCIKECLGEKGAMWCICPTNIDKNSIVYSFGIGTDISFDLGLIAKYKMNINAFDPTPRSKDWLQNQTLPKTFHFHDYGIADYDGNAVFEPPKNETDVSYRIIRNSSSEHGALYSGKVYKLKTIINMLKHKKIDILKMDVEGSEFSVIDDLVRSDIYIHQLLIEFHHRFKGNSIFKTIKAIRSLNEKGYKIFYISPNKEEYSFIKVY